MEFLLIYIGVGILFAMCAEKLGPSEGIGSPALIAMFWLPILFTIALFGKEE